MSRPFLIVLQAILAVSFGVQNDRPALTRDQAVKQESQRVQGLWQYTSLRENGKDATQAELKDRTFVFSGDVFVIRQGEQFLQGGNQSLDPTKSPKTANFSIAEGPGKGTILLGIYESDGDTFRLSFDPEGQKRPTEFKADAGSGLSFAVFKRVRSDDEPKLNIAGEYTSVGAGANGASLIQDVEIERRGDTYVVTWKRNNATASTGIGLLTGDIFSVSWVTQTQRGIAVYKADKDRRLVGRYGTFGTVGILVNETMTPK